MKCHEGHRYVGSSTGEPTRDKANGEFGARDTVHASWVHQPTPSIAIRVIAHKIPVVRVW